ncbi:DUF6653 family protein [Roseibium salinum]|uniref:Protein-S-isoprenylcysteine O-methyltransferase Ste14 n=1 Tax=Roseibium salinum TaxID=1604349 RepID=A0ABT3R1M4_9HYPH|nr:DUF6653 family protein [Roseibium sp. DSM 29163]MCX2722978.1 hypothetical protein [Roseibium sp. DSM 29163]MDN3719087.1 hypothetical protein [Roseibium salinum]
MGANTRLLFASGGAGKPTKPAATYTRLIAPGLLTAALWTHIWLGVTGSVLVTMAAVLVLVSISRLPVASAHRNGWATLVGFGERIWLNRLAIPIPPQINHRLIVLYLVIWTGNLAALLGALTALPLLSATGLLVAYTAQSVSYQTLIQLYRVMQDKDPLYRFWTARTANDNKPAGSARKRA